MRFTLLLATTFLGIVPASASLINFTFTQGLGSVDVVGSNSNLVWTAEFDLLTHPASPFTTPSGGSGPFTAVGTPIINWSGDMILSIVDATVFDTSSGLTWTVDQGPAGGHLLAQGTSKCPQPCSDFANDFQNYGIPNPGFRLASTLDTWQGVAVTENAVPEPGGIMLTLFGGLVLITRIAAGRRKSMRSRLDCCP
jgi:hypothetical protein